MLLALGVAHGQIVPMTNDDCSTAIVLSDGVNPSPPAGLSSNFYTLAGSTVSSAWSCGTVTAGDVWFSYTATSTGITTFTTCTPSGFTAGGATNTVMEVLTDACPTPALIACNDNFCASRAQVQIATTVGTTYLVRVAPSGATAATTFYLRVAPPLANDECSSPTPIFDGNNPGAPAGASGSFFSAEFASVSAGVPAMCASIFGDVWFSYTATTTGTTTFSTCPPTGFTTTGVATNTVIDVLTDACPTPTVLACNDNFCTNRAQVSVATTAGTTYLVRVAMSTATATTIWGFYLRVILPPSNDECATPIVISDGVNPGAPLGTSGSFYTLEAASNSLPASCAATFGDAWFSYTATSTTTKVFSTCPPAGFTTTGVLTNTVLDVLDDTCPTPTQLACNDNFCTNRAQVSMAVTAGTTYLIRVGASSATATTVWGFYLTVGDPPVNDECVNAIPVSLGANGPFNNHFGTNSAMPLSCGVSGSPGNKDVFFTFTPICSGSYRIDTNITPIFDTNLAVFDACGGTELACDDDGGPGLDSLIASVALTGGVPYIIKVGSWSATNTGTFMVNIALVGGGLAWSSPLGPGSIQFDITGGPSGGTYFHAIDFFPGAFPNGWFFGLDIPPFEIFNQIGFGFPFVGPLDVCGAISFGPIGGLPSGFTLYSVALTMSGPGLTGVATPTAPATHTIP